MTWVIPDVPSYLKERIRREDLLLQDFIIESNINGNEGNEGNDHSSAKLQQVSQLSNEYAAINDDSTLQETKGNRKLTSEIITSV